jgi:hypothetical protein
VEGDQNARVAFCEYRQRDRLPPPLNVFIGGSDDGQLACFWWLLPRGSPTRPGFATNISYFHHNIGWVERSYTPLLSTRIVAWTLDKPHSGVFSGSGQDPPILCGPSVRRTNSLGPIFHVFFYIITLRWKERSVHNHLDWSACLCFSWISKLSSHHSGRGSHAQIGKRPLAWTSKPSCVFPKWKQEGRPFTPLRVTHLAMCLFLRRWDLNTPISKIKAHCWCSTVLAIMPG